MPKKGEERKEKPMPQGFVTLLLRNPNRAAIRRLLERRPGMNKHQLATETGIHVNAVGFHVERLVKAGLLEVRPGAKGREKLCFTPENVHLWENPATRALYGRGPARQVAMFLAENPGTGVKEACKALNMSVHTVRRHIRELEEAELVQRMRIERQVVYHAEPELIRWAEEMSEGQGAD